MDLGPCLGPMNSYLCIQTILVMAKKELPKPVDDFAFGKENYILMIIGIVCILTGFLLMSGGGNEDPSVWNEKEIFSTRRITVAPLMVVLGFVIEVFAIIRRPKD